MNKQSEIQDLLYSLSDSIDIHAVEMIQNCENLQQTLILLQTLKQLFAKHTKAIEVLEKENIVAIKQYRLKNAKLY